MRAIVLCDGDWGNVGQGFVDAFNAVGIAASGFTQQAHAFKYERALPVGSKQQMQDGIKKADIVIYCHTVPLGLTWNKEKRKVAVFHGGSRYRAEPKGGNTGRQANRVPALNGWSEDRPMGRWRDPMTDWTPQSWMNFSDHV